MSLKVWLPLCGNLKQQGTSNIVVNNNGATINTNGKIGNCYYFNASSYLYENTYNWSNFNTSQFSFCCWYKQPSPVASGNSQIICIGTSSGWNNIRIGLLRRTSNGYPMFSVSDGTNAVQYNCTATTFTLDTWNHITCTYDNGIIKIYLNGILNKTYTTTITPVLNTSQHLGIGAASNGAEKLTGYLNDVRIYDHCLSAAEVHEISQGLILHYKLDDITNGIQDSSGYSHNGNIVGNLSIINNTKRYSFSTKWNSSSPTTNDETGICYIQTPITLTTPLQLSFTWWAKPENGYGGATNHAALCTSNNISRPSDYNTTAFHHRDAGFDIYPSDGSGVKRLGFSQYTKNEWHHYALTYDGSTARSYKDGVESTSIAVGTNKTLATFTQLYIGYSQAGGVRRKTLGSYSDFRMYCTALTATDIKQLYEIGAKIDKSGNLHTFELNEFGSNKLTKTGIFKDNIIEPFITLSDGSKWQLLLYHYVKGGTNLFTSSNATYCNDFGLYSRLRYIDNFKYTNTTYEFYVIQDGIEFRWTQTNAPMTTTSITGYTAVTGTPNGICKCSGNTVLARSSTTGNWWNACGCYTAYQGGIPGFGQTVCKNYLALYARVSDFNAKIADMSAYFNNYIEF